MTVAIILILILAWVAFLAPTLLRARNNQVRSDSVGDFHHRLRALGRTNGTHRKGARPRSQQPILGPMTTGNSAMSPTQRRRRDVLLVLAGLVVATALYALYARSTTAIVLQLIADAALGGYVYLLVEYKRRSQRNVHPLAHVPRVPGPSVPYPTIDLTALEHDAEPSGPRLVPLRQTVPG